MAEESKEAEEEISMILRENLAEQPPNARERIEALVKEHGDGVVAQVTVGQAAPGYGHAALRVIDPRFATQFQFAKDRFLDDEILHLAAMLAEVVPHVLRERGKAKDPQPNVDAISGTLQHRCGVRELDFYTVLFGIGRALGITANYVWACASGMPIERPKSATAQMLEDAVRREAMTA